MDDMDGMDSEQIRELVQEQVRAQMEEDMDDMDNFDDGDQIEEGVEDSGR